MKSEHIKKADRFAVLQNIKIICCQILGLMIQSSRGDADRPPFPVSPVLKYEVHTWQTWQMPP